MLWSLIPNWVDLISPNFTVNPPPHFHTLPTQLRFGAVARDRHQSEVVCYAKQVVRYRESKSPQVAPPPGLAGCLPAKAVSAHCEHTAAAARAHYPPALQCAHSAHLGWLLSFARFQAGLSPLRGLTTNKSHAGGAKLLTNRQTQRCAATRACVDGPAFARFRGVITAVSSAMVILTAALAPLLGAAIVVNPSAASSLARPHRSRITRATATGRATATAPSWQLASTLSTIDALERTGGARPHSLLTGLFDEASGLCSEGVWHNSWLGVGRLLNSRELKISSPRAAGRTGAPPRCRRQRTTKA